MKLTRNSRSIFAAVLLCGATFSPRLLAGDYKRGYAVPSVTQDRDECRAIAAQGAEALKRLTGIAFEADCHLVDITDGVKELVRVYKAQTHPTPGWELQVSYEPAVEYFYEWYLSKRFFLGGDGVTDPEFQWLLFKTQNQKVQLPECKSRAAAAIGAYDGEQCVFDAECVPSSHPQSTVPRIAKSGLKPEGLPFPCNQAP